MMMNKILAFCVVLLLTTASCSKNAVVEATRNAADKTTGENNGRADREKNRNYYKPPVDIPNDDHNQVDSDCYYVVCTTEFRMIDLAITDAAGNPVMLTSFYTEDMLGNKMPASLYGYDPYRKAYMVFNDSWMKNNQNSVIQVRFVGFKNSTKVVDELYTISSDCCHITKVSGKDAIVLP